MFIEKTKVSESYTDCLVISISLGSLTLLLSSQAPLPNKVSCFVSMCVSLGNSLLNVKQEPILKPWKMSVFLQQMAILVGWLLHYDWHLENLGYSGTSLPVNRLDPAAATRTLCPWFPLNVNDWPECPDWVKDKKFYWLPPLPFPLSFFFSTPSLLSFILLSWSWLWGSGWRDTAWSEGRELKFWSYIWDLVSGRAEFPSLLSGNAGKRLITPRHLQVVGDVPKVTCFVSLSSPLSNWYPFLSLKSLKTWDISIYSNC